MSRIFLVSVLFLLLSSTSSKGTTMVELQSLFSEFNTSPFVNLLLIYDSARKDADLLEKAMEQIAAKRNGYFGVKLVDCNTDDKDVAKNFIYCQDDTRPQLPALMFSEPSLNPHEASTTPGSAPMKQFQGALDEKSLFNFAVPLMKTFSIELRTVKDFNKFQNSLPGTPKIIYFTDKQKIPPLFRALTANFRDTIAFAHVFSKSTLAKEMEIQSYPVFLINGKQKMEVKGNLNELLERFDLIKGEKTTIDISEYKSNPTVEITPQNVQQKVYQLPEHTLVHVPAADGSEHPQWQKIMKKWKKMFTMYETAPSMKDAFGLKQVPSIIYFPKSVAKKKVMKTVFTAKNTYQEIHDQIHAMIDDFTLPLSNGMEMQKHTGIHLQDQKFVAVFFHDEEIPLSYKLISNDKIFDEEVTFFRMKNPDSQIAEQFSIKKLPALIVMMIDDTVPKEEPTKKQIQQGRSNMNLKLASYTGKFVYEDIYAYFSSFSKKAQQELRRSKTSHQDELEPQSAETKILRRIGKSSQFNKFCQDQNCYMLLLDGKKENQSKNIESILSLDSEAYKVAASNFGYTDAVCHSEILASLEIMEDELPALVYFNPKLGKYARMVGRLEARSINTFFAKVKANKANYRGYDKIDFSDKDCNVVHEKIKKMQSASAEISQEQASIIEELRAEETKKRQEFQKAEKDEKIRKKNRKRRPKKEWEEEL